MVLDSGQSALLADYIGEGFKELDLPAVQFPGLLWGIDNGGLAF